MTDKITLTPAPYAVFSTLAACGGTDVNYRALRTASGYDDKKNFPNLIQELASKDLIQCAGPQKTQVVSLKVDPETVVLVTKQPAGKGDNSKPKAKSADLKERKCLKCRAPFMSSGPGERICKVCKGSTDWSDNPYAPVGGGVRRVSEIKAGV